MSTKTMYELYAITYRDTLVDLIEEISLTLVTVMPLQDEALCWTYLVDHFYYNNYYGEA